MTHDPIPMGHIHGYQEHRVANTKNMSFEIYKMVANNTLVDNVPDRFSKYDILIVNSSILNS